MRPEFGIAWVRRVSDRRVFGLAFAVDKRLLVTCAHVVNAALDRPLRDASRPDESELELVFPYAEGARGHQPRRSAGVAVWLPSEADTFDLDDVALLEIYEDLPGGVPLLKPAAEIRHDGGAVRMVGPVPKGARHVYVDGELMGAADRSRFHIDQRLRGILRVKPGFSGGPVWYPENGRVVGILQAASLDDRAADVYVIGRDTIRQVYSEFGPRRAVDRVAVGATVLFGAIGALAAVAKVGWSWVVPVTGLAVAAAVYVVGRFVR